MKTANGQKSSFGKAQFSRIKRVRYLASRDAFEVEFEDGQKIIEPHNTIRAANGISPTARFKRLEVENSTRSGFIGHYDNGQTAEVSWSFLRELPPADPPVGETSYSADRPIYSKDEDKLGRVEFASGLARDLRMWGGKDSLVVALYGEWGCGKTSIKNLILEANKASGDARLGTMQFNPWQISGIGSIPDSFFRELDIALRTEVPGEKAEKAAARLKVYASTLALSGTAIESVGKVLPWLGVPLAPAVEAVGKGMKGAGTLAKVGSEAAKAKKDAATKSLHEQKALIAQVLAKLVHPLLVVIDDIDRLTTDEILQVFQLVKANADFPNLIYLLLFDRGVAAEALDRVSGKKGNEFLEKIVQVGYHVPQASRAAIQKVLFQGLDKELADEMVVKWWDKHRWSELYQHGISGYFKNLRHVYRFLSSFNFQVRHHRQTGSFEVNPIDLIGIEALRVFEPNVYEHIPGAKTILTRDNGSTLFGEIKQSVVDEAVSQICSHATAGNANRVRGILGQVFPPISSSYATRSDVSQHHPDWLRQLRACHPDLFDRYFTLVIGENDLSKAEVERLIKATNNAIAFETAFRSLTARGLLSVTFDRLDAYRETIPFKNVHSVVVALCNVCDELPIQSPGMFELNPLTNAWWLVYFSVKREADENRRFDILEKAISESRGLALPTEIASMEERTQGRESQDHEFLVSEENAARLRQLCIMKYKESLNKEEFATNPRLNVFLWRWSQWGALDEVRTWIDAKTRTPEGVLWFLLIALGESHSWGRDHRVRYFIKLSTIERFAHLERIKSLASRLKRDKLSKRERIALRELDKAIARRAAGKSDDAWQSDFDNKDEEVID